MGFHWLIPGLHLDKLWQILYSKYKEESMSDYLISHHKYNDGDEVCHEVFLEYRGKQIGSISGSIENGSSTLRIGSSGIDKEFRNKGFGLKIYEHLFARSGAKTICSNDPSLGAKRVHLSICRKYRVNSVSYNFLEQDHYSYPNPLGNK